MRSHWRRKLSLQRGRYALAKAGSTNVLLARIPSNPLTTQQRKMKKLALFSIAALGHLGAGSAQAACFTVYDAQHKIIYQNTESPVDMRLPIGDAVKLTHGQGAALIFSPFSEHCYPIFDAPQEPSPKARAPEVRPAELQARLVPPEAAAPLAPTASAASRTEEGGNANVSERAAAGPRASSSGFSFGSGKTSRRRR